MRCAGLGAEVYLGFFEGPYFVLLVGAVPPPLFGIPFDSRIGGVLMSIGGLHSSIGYGIV